MLVIKCTSGLSALAPGAATPPGTSPGLIQAFNHHPWSPKPSQGIYTFIWIQLRRRISIGCLLVVDNGKASPKVQNISTIMTGFFPFAAMGNQAGFYERQSARRRQEGRGEQLYNFLQVVISVLYIKNWSTCPYMTRWDYRAHKRSLFQA